MFRKILIANRGEIACRVIATAKQLGVATVAIYSDADRAAKHVAMADEAVRIGPSPVAESYLCGARIIDAARSAGADAIHPGYGFLSENPEFVEAVEAAGLVFIGPPAPAIRAMGLKDAAKALMANAGVPVVPGYHGERQDPEFLSEKAAQIGYPILIKARAGGGGKGMRRVDAPGEFHTALESAKREAEASFGDPACLIEKYVATPRHIEIQVFGDSHGHVVHLFERDCSLQRRHQKVIEEAPAPGMTEAVRRAMGQAAIEAARAIGYEGAGTVEFIADGTGPLREDGFWFMEMNTRLQVEHPVSEAITGLDFVELQLRIAAGDPLPFAQDELTIDGWSFEARLYAEDVPKGFLPATGRLDHAVFPTGTAFTRGSVRTDSGIRPGDDISPWYDPMIAKIITHGPTRQSALNLLQRALADTELTGCTTNLNFLGALARHPGFQSGQVDTGLIARDLATLAPDELPPENIVPLAAIAALGLTKPRDASNPWDALVGWRHWAEAHHVAALDWEGTRMSRDVYVKDQSTFRVANDDGEFEVLVEPLHGTTFRITTGRFSHNATIIHGGTQVSVSINGKTFTFGLPDMLAGLDASDVDSETVNAPMPGLIKLVSAEAGAAVTKGQTLLVLEAMKMEHALAAPRDGTVAEVMVQAGDQVAAGSLLLALDPEDG